MGGSYSFQANVTKRVVEQYFSEVARIVGESKVLTNLRTGTFNGLKIEYCNPNVCYAGFPPQDIPLNFRAQCSSIVPQDIIVNQSGLVSSELTIQTLSQVSQEVKTELQSFTTEYIISVIEENPDIEAAVISLGFNKNNLSSSLSQEIVRSINSNATAVCKGLTISSNNSTLTICGPIGPINIDQNAAAISAASCIAKQITEQMGDNEILIAIFREVDRATSASGGGGGNGETNSNWIIVGVIVAIIVIIVIIVLVVVSSRKKTKTPPSLPSNLYLPLPSPYLPSPVDLSLPPQLTFPN